MTTTITHFDYPCPFCNDTGTMSGQPCVCTLGSQVHPNMGMPSMRKTTPASSATSGEVCAHCGRASGERRDECENCPDHSAASAKTIPDSAQQGKMTADEVRAALKAMPLEHVVSMVRGAQQGEDEPPLPLGLPVMALADEFGSGSYGYTIDQLRQYGDARAAHAVAHMMRKLGDGAVDHEAIIELAREAGFGISTCFIMPPRVSGHITSEVEKLVKLAQALAAGAERAVPEGWEQAAAFIEKKAQDYINEHADTGHDTGAVVWRYGDAGRDYHSSLVELAEELRAAAQSLQEGKAVDGWISVADRLPEQRERAYQVIACCVKKYGDDTNYPGQGIKRIQQDWVIRQWPQNFTHWMPLLPLEAAQQDSVQEGGAA